MAKGVTIKELLKNAPREHKGRIKNVRARRISSNVVNGMPEVRFKTRSLEPTTARQPPVLETVIRLYPRLYRGKRHYWLSCDCEDHLFRWEYALAQIDASDIIYGNGEPPRERNPRLLKSCCKHALRALQIRSTQQTLEGLRR